MAGAQKQGRPALLRAGEASCGVGGAGAGLTLETLADAPAVFHRVCRRAVRSSKMLTGAAAALAVLLAGCAGGIFAPAADLGSEPLLCALLGLAVTGLTVLPAMAGTPETDQNRINDKRTRRASPCAFYVLMRPPPDRCR